jgi:nicotinamide mononucleotide (NMN) deamidase PncC
VRGGGGMKNFALASFAGVSRVFKGGGIVRLYVDYSDFFFSLI